MYKGYKGRFSPTNFQKYKGDPTKIIYRSLWERKFMIWCDTNPNILEWGSEEFFIPYISPVDGRMHRYFPDFYVKLRSTTGKVKRYVVEVKPLVQCKAPKKPKRQTKRYISEVKTYAVNQAKWKAAVDFCGDRLWEFKVITEKELKI